MCRTREDGRRRGRARSIATTIGQLNEKILQKRNFSNTRKIYKFSPIHRQEGIRVPNTSSSWYVSVLRTTVRRDTVKCLCNIIFALSIVRMLILFQMQFCSRCIHVYLDILTAASRLAYYHYSIQSLRYETKLIW